MVDEKTKKEIWNLEGAEITKEAMDFRIKAAVSQRGWQEVVRIFEKKGIPISALRVAEIGCGTGTMALTFGLLGASVTLIDFNEKALRRSRKIYEMYGCTAQFLERDCIEDPPAELIDTFDIVISLGLVEHFSGSNRKRCIEYHRLLAKKDGVVLITVPNRYNLFYWSIRGIRTLTGTWTIDVEIPFSSSELIKTARETGFAAAYVFGYVGLWRDLLDSIYALGYAILDCLPKKWIVFLRDWNARTKRAQLLRAQTTEEMSVYCRQAAKAAHGQTFARAISKITGAHCSILALIAFR